MDKQHPHFGATYEISPLPDGSFEVEVSIPNTRPVKVTGFDVRASAEAWIAGHQRQIATGTIARGRLRPWKK
jgi:hypothetical protein